ncbi:4264_t:CDS:2 [Paraglomus brasilianum]|uniref:4264_t:CDS:1 n=1 Tax=Paraglomus brasilianum TaxID=144538 RepID=A0A9N9DT25_9GLOM|nr:4264_t:CDS:2 [Paraglomus brasilianum]
MATTVLTRILRSGEVLGRGAARKLENGSVLGRINARTNGIRFLHKSQNNANASSATISPETPTNSLPPSLSSTTASSMASGSNMPLAFPCIDHLTTRTLELSLESGGPEPSYEKVVTGYELFHYDKPFLCDYGGILPSFKLAYETWGTLNEKKDNVILLHTGLSASSHAKSHAKNKHDGWWEKFIGPGASLDTNKFFIICTNALGGCYGSTGPSSLDPADNERYATRFPIITMFDMVRAQFHLLDHLGIDKLHASVGSSMGGMQSLVAGALYPERVGRLISISACARSHPYSIALRHTQRQVLMSDPNWKKGFYYSSVPPHIGMKLAREIATITYRSGPEWERRFGRKRALEDQTPALCPDFLIETYLDYQGEKFCLQYDPNSLLYISKAMDLFDMSASELERLSKLRQKNQAAFSSSSTLQPNSQSDQQCYFHSPTPNRQSISSLESTGASDLEDLIQGLSTIKIPSLVLGVQSDSLFPYWQQKEVAECLKRSGNKDVTYYELDSLYGHDTFLIDLTTVGSAVKGHLELGG